MMQTQDTISAATINTGAPATTGEHRALVTQRTFRVVLDAMATPGNVRQLPWQPPIAALADSASTWSAALVLTLTDHEVALAPVLGDRSERFADEMRRWTGTQMTTVPNADFVVADPNVITPEDVLALRRGSLEYPDDSALLILEVEALGAADGQVLTLTGPGIAERIDMTVTGLPPVLITARDEAVRQYPTGIDVLLVDRHGRVAGLPRTTRIAPMNGGER